MALSLFNGGYLPLEQRSMAENLFWAICDEAAEASCQAMAEVPEDLQNLDEQLSDTYFCNFSLFQSIPDSWAIKQLFPVMPIHRLNEKPLEPRGDRRHHLRFGRQARSLRRSPRREEDAAAASARTATTTTSACSSSARIRKSSATCTTCSATRTPCTSRSTSTATARLDALIKGDTVNEVLDYVEFDAETLLSKLRTDVETAVRAGRMDYEGAGRLLRFYEDGLHGYTYLGRLGRSLHPAPVLTGLTRDSRMTTGACFSTLNLF